MKIRLKTKNKKMNEDISIPATLSDPNLITAYTNLARSKQAAEKTFQNAQRTYQNTVNTIESQMLQLLDRQKNVSTANASNNNNNTAK